MSKEDTINNPSHYAHSIETIDAIEAWGLDTSFCLANAVKYLSRCNHKGNKLDDLKKARWYIDREIGKLEKKNA